jgi:hypothetical protein
MYSDRLNKLKQNFFLDVSRYLSIRGFLGMYLTRNCSSSQDHSGFPVPLLVHQIVVSDWS